MNILILFIGFYIGAIWAIAVLWHRLTKRCWGQIAFHDEIKQRNITLRCKKHQGHDGKHYWANISREKYKEW